MKKTLIFLGLSLLLLGGCAAAPGRGSVSDSVNAGSRPAEFAGASSASDPSDGAQPPPEPEEGSADGGEVVPQSGLEYFEFERSGREECAPGGLHLLTENRCNVTFHSPDPALSGWVNGILQQARDRFDRKSSELLHDAREFIRAAGTESFYTYSNYEDLSVARQDGRVASVVTISHVHSGGAHPNSVQTALNLDLANRRELRLEDVIEEAQAPELGRLVQAAVEEKFAPLDLRTLYEDAPQTIRQSLEYGRMTPYWYFDWDSLVIFYNQYELGPYAAGIIKAELPYQALRGVLKDEFFPKAQEPSNGDLSIADRLGGRETISLKLGEESGQILLAPTGPIREIQVSEIFRVDETPVTQTMMLSLREMNERQVLAVMGGFPDESRSFLVEYVDGAGILQQKYLHSDGLSDQP